MNTPARTRGLLWGPYGRRSYIRKIERPFPLYQAEAAVSGQDNHIEFRIRRYDGIYRWFQTRLVAGRDPQGRVLKWFGSCTDVQESRERAERFSRIVATAPGVLCHFTPRPDGSWAVPFASPALLDLYGLDPAGLAEDASPVVDAIHPDDHARFLENIPADASGTALWREEYRVRHPVKGEIWVAGSAALVREPDGTVNWYGFLFDVTERNRAKVALRERTQQELRILQTLVERAPMGIAMFGRRMRAIEASQRWLDEFGLTREQFLGRVITKASPLRRRGAAGYRASYMTRSASNSWRCLCLPPISTASPVADARRPGLQTDAIWHMSRTLLFLTTWAWWLRCARRAANFPNGTRMCRPNSLRPF